MQEIELKTNQRLNALNKISSRYVFGRFFTAVVFLSVFFFQLEANLNIAIQLIALVAFLILVYYHKVLMGKIYFLENKKQVIKDEWDRRNGLNIGQSNGHEFEDYSHEYSNDLNVFGKFSMFQYINRSYFSLGRYSLAEILKQNNVSANENKWRRIFVSNLEPNEEWMIDLFTFSKIIEEKLSSKKKEITYHEDLEQYKIDSVLKYPTRLLYFQIILMIGIVVGLFYNYMSSFFLSIVLSTISYFYNKNASKYIKNQKEHIHAILIYASKLKDIAKHCQTLSIKSDLFNKLIKQLNRDEGFVARARGLEKQIDILSYSKLPFFGSSSNIFYQFINNLIALDFLLVSKISGWLARYGKSVPSWLNAIGQIEAFSSISMYSISKRKDFVFPTIQTSKFEIKCEGLGHPLLHETSEVITNNVSIDKSTTIILITGSNMSGKSTYMRSIGCNLILAKIGSRVFAKSFRYYPHTLFTSFEIKDNISKGKSTFLAEVSRLKCLVKLIENGNEPFFLLDEILRGTNSKDRIKGSLELVGKLKKYDCFGYITSHDLTLPEILMDELHHSFFYFSSKIIDGDLHFDYKIQKGICPETNGYFILKKNNII